jgi:hypothetical protein
MESMRNNLSFTRAIYLMIFLLLMGQSLVRAQEESGVEQHGMVDFPGIGRLRIEVIKSRNSNRVVFRSNKTGKIVNPLTRAGQRPDASRLKVSAREAIYFKIENSDSVSSPLIYVTTVYRGADHCAFTMQVIGEVAGRLRFLTSKPFETDDMGGMHVGDLGQQRGQGVAVWSFIWGNDEAHFEAHRYKFELYKYESNKQRFVKITTVNSKRRYQQGKDAAQELHLPYKNFLLSCEELFGDDGTLYLNKQSK